MNIFKIYPLSEVNSVGFRVARDILKNFATIFDLAGNSPCGTFRLRFGAFAIIDITIDNLVTEI